MDNQNQTPAGQTSPPPTGASTNTPAQTATPPVTDISAKPAEQHTAATPPAPAPDKPAEGTPPQPSSPGTPPASPPTPSAAHTAKKPVMLMLGIFVLILLIAGGVVFALGAMNKTQRLGAYKNTSVQPTPKKISPTANPLSAEEQEIEAIDTGDPETDLQDLEKDLNSL